MAAPDFLRAVGVDIESVADSVREALLLLDSELRIMWANQAFYRGFQMTAADTLGRLLYDVGDRQFDISELSELIEQVLPAETEFNDFQIDRGGRVLLLNGRQVGGEGEKSAILLAIEDVTEHKEAERLGHALNEISTIIHSTLDLDEIMDRVFAKVAEALHADAVLVALREQRSWIIGYGTENIRRRRGLNVSGEAASIFARAAISMKTEVISGSRMYKSGILDLFGKLGYQAHPYSVLVAPLRVKDNVIGALLATGGVKSKFGENQVDFFGSLAASVSLGLENSRLYVLERSIANALQKPLLRLPTRVEGIEYGHLYHSGTVGTRVGGDFYDLFEIGDESVGVTIGDVSGKGLEAAALTAIVKATIRAYALEGSSPAEVVSKTNRVVETTATGFEFVTLFFGVINLQAGSLTYCNAGHPPALLKNGTHRVELLGIGAPPVGVLYDALYSDSYVKMCGGCTLVLYTDGVTEAGEVGNLFGEKRLVKLLEKWRQTTAELPAAIFREIHNFSGGSLRDDVAIVTVSVS